MTGAARRGPSPFPAPRQAMTEAGRPLRPGESVARLRGAISTQDNGGVLPSVSVRRSGDIWVWGPGRVKAELSGSHFKMKVRHALTPADPGVLTRTSPLPWDAEPCHSDRPVWAGRTGDGEGAGGGCRRGAPGPRHTGLRAGAPATRGAGWAAVPWVPGPCHLPSGGRLNGWHLGTVPRSGKNRMAQRGSRSVLGGVWGRHPAPGLGDVGRSKPWAHRSSGYTFSRYHLKGLQPSLFRSSSRL